MSRFLEEIAGSARARQGACPLDPMSGSVLDSLRRRQLAGALSALRAAVIRNHSPRSRRPRLLAGAGSARVLLALLLLTTPALAEDFSAIGRAPHPGEVAAWDIDVRFDGLGLPPGQGSALEGEEPYIRLCASCHGDFGYGEGRNPALVGGSVAQLAQHGPQASPPKTVGSFWPFAPVLFDYIRRTMPFGAAQTLSDGETYALTAYVLWMNEIVAEDAVMDAATLPAVQMPNRDGFFDDNRPDVEATACMADCKPVVEIVSRVQGGVTPE